MPAELRDIVQRMIDADEPEENIAAVIKEYNFRYPIVKKEVLTKQEITEPTTFGEGFKRSIMGGEALNTGLRGAQGYLQGAIGDLPASMVGALGSIGDALWTTPTEASQNRAMISNPLETGQNLLSKISESILTSGAHPEEFGRTMGQMTGQPIATAGIAPRIAGIAPKAVGIPTEVTGRVLRKYQPVSGLLPWPLNTRTLRLLERGFGHGMERFGKWLQPEIPPSPTPRWIPSETPIPSDADLARMRQMNLDFPNITFKVK